jgi:hypothetical protein
MSMRTIRIEHEFDPIYGWSFESPDLTGLIGGPANDDDYQGSQHHAESAVRFVLECDAEDRGEAVPDDVTVVHIVRTAAQPPAARAS